MITLRQLASEIIELESGGGQSIDSSLSLPYVIQYVRQMSNIVLAPKIFEKLAQDDRSTLHLMLVTYTISVVKDEDGNESITLPEFYMSLPYNRGLHAIAPVDDPTNHFIPRHNPAVSRNLPCSTLEEDQHSYWTKGLNVYFDGEVELGKVLVDLLVASPDSVGINDPLPIYPEHQIEIIQKVREMIKTMGMADTRLDGNPNIAKR